MEKEDIDIFEREDRENDLDDIDINDFKFDENKDYTDYLREVKGKIFDEGNSAAEGLDKEVPKRKPGRGSQGKKKESARKTESDDLRSIQMSFMTTPPISEAIRVIAVASHKTPSTLINDLILASIGAEIDEVINSGLLKRIAIKDR